MIYSKKKMEEIVGEITKLVAEYSEYPKVKKGVNIESTDKIIWSKFWIEPFCTDYITELNDNTIIPRKLLKKEPLTKKYVSVHHMADNTPVYSKFYGDKDNVVYEKFFIKKENLLIGALFHCSDKKLCGLTVEHFDEKGRPIEFDRFSMDGESKRKLDSIFYTYDNDRIIKAESIFSLDIDRELKLYDDELYVKIGLILEPSIERMNPESVETFDFDYNDKMELDFYTRTAFSYGRVISHKWKIKKSIIKSYIECGIGWLGK